MKKENREGFYPELEVLTKWNNFLTCPDSGNRLAEISADLTIQPVFQRKAIEKLLRTQVPITRQDGSTVDWRDEVPTLENSKHWFASLSEENKKYAVNQIIYKLDKLAKADAPFYLEDSATTDGRRTYSFYLLDAIPALDKDTARKAIDNLYLDLNFPESRVITSCYLSDEIPMEYKKQLAERVRKIFTQEPPANKQQEYYLSTMSYLIRVRNCSIDDQFLLSEINSITEIAPYFINKTPINFVGFLSLLRNKNAKRAAINYLKEMALDKQLDSYNQLRRLRKLIVAERILFPEEKGEMAEVGTRIKELEVVEKKREHKQEQESAKEKRLNTIKEAQKAKEIEEAIKSLR